MTTRYLYEWPGGQPRYYVNDKTIYTINGKAEFYIVDDYVYSYPNSAPAYWIKDKHLYEVGTSQPSFYFSE